MPDCIDAILEIRAKAHTEERSTLGNVAECMEGEVGRDRA